MTVRALREPPPLQEPAPMPPHSVEAEQAVIGALLLDNAALERCTGLISEQHFYRADHRAIWRAAASLIEAGTPADVITVAEAMETAGTLDQAGGLGYLATLAQNTPSAANAGHYAAIVAEKAKRRRMAELGNRLAAAANAGQPVEELAAEVLKAASAGITGKRRFSLVHPDALSSVMPMREVVRGVFPATGLGAIYGASGSGKSFLVLDFLGAVTNDPVTTDPDWFGHAIPTPRKAVYVALEGEAGISKRAAARMAKHGPLDGLRVILSPLDIRQPDDRRELVAAIKAEGFSDGVLVLDTLNRAAAGFDENDPKGMGEAIGALKEIQAELGGLVLVVHHSGKDATKGMRGHTSLLAALDCAIEVTRQDERREWKLSKSKDGPDGLTHPFTLEVVELGNDADGWPVSSCVIRPEEQAAVSVSRTNLPRGGNQKIVWDALGELLKTSNDFGQAGAPQTRPCVKLEDAIHAIRDRLPCPADRQTERTRAAITGLISKGLIHHREGWIWCA